MAAPSESLLVRASKPTRTRLLWLALSLFLTVGYGTVCSYLLIPFNYFLGLLPTVITPIFGPVLWLTLVIVATRIVYRNISRNGPQRAIIAAEVLVFLVLPLTGTLFDWALGSSCIETDCDTLNVHRPFALPEFLHVWVLHLLTVLAYAVSRRRTGSLPARTELVVLGGMLAGCVLQIALGAQLAIWLVYGIVGAPLILCAASPVFVLLLFIRQIRVCLTGHAQGARVVVGAASVAAGCLGLYALIEAAFGKHKGAVLDVFTRTCGHTLSQLPIVHQPCTGHYLCTVAACGHPTLVRPLRLGLRRGEPIVVNRQLAIANAFEELLHERFPRFGRAARCIYDRLGLPLSRWVRHRLLADLVYLLMKPAELLFYTVLLLLDPSDPEGRLARMYPWSEG